MTAMISNQLTEFLRKMIFPRTGLLEKIEKECRVGFFPMVLPETGQYIQLMLKALKPSNILEIGTGIGYSTLLMAEVAAETGGKIITIEIDPDRYQHAEKNFKEKQVTGIVRFILGDALKIIPEIGEKYDFVFMDAAKGQYPEFIAKVWPFILPGGVLLIDNVFLGGWVIEKKWPSRRKKTMVVRVSEMLEKMKENPEMFMSIIPFGDGLAVCVKRQDAK